MVQSKSFNLYPARTAGMLSGARRTATLLLVTLLLTMTAQTAWAQDFSAYGIVSETPTIDKNASNFIYDSFRILDYLFDGTSIGARTREKDGYNPNVVSVVFYFDTPITPVGYIMWVPSATDYIPTSWTLKAKANSDDDWTILDTKDNSDYSQLPKTGLLKKAFYISNDKVSAYKYFCLEGTGSGGINGSSGLFELGELQFFTNDVRYNIAPIRNVSDYYDYTGSAIDISYDVETYSGTSLAKGTDYTISLNGTDVTSQSSLSVTDKGVYTMTVTGTGAYNGTQSRTFYVVGNLSTDANGHYLISDAVDWASFTAKVVSGTSYAGETVKLTSDIPTAAETAAGITSATTMVGTLDKQFKGTFDGGGHTLNIQVGSADDRFNDIFVAPFRAINGATIKNLQVAGAIYSGAANFSGLVGQTFGDSKILNCRSSIEINTTKNDGAGIANGINGYSGYGHSIIVNCLFDGKITAGKCAGLVYNTNGDFQITNCLFAPELPIVSGDNCSTISNSYSYGTSTITNCYYTHSLGTVQGEDASGMSNTELAAALGPMWEVSGGIVQPIYNTNHLSGATVSGLSHFYRYTGSEISLVYSLKDLEGNDLTEGTHYSVSLTCGGSPVTEVQSEGDYTITFTGIGAYSGTKEATFTVMAYPDGLSIDEDFSAGDDGYFYVNIPVDNPGPTTIDLTGEADGFTFKVYDDGGKDGDYNKDECTETVVLTAPSGYVLQVTGTAQTLVADILSIYDGTDTSGSALFYHPNPGNIGTVISTGQNMTIHFNKRNGTQLNSIGLDLTVKLINMSNDYNISINNPLSGGEVSSNVLIAKVFDDIALTATPANGYLLNGVSVKDTYNNNVNVEKGRWYDNNTASFKMSSSDVVVTPTFTNDLTSLYINMPSSGVENAIIPASVTSFKIYDNGGKDNRYNVSDGDVVLTAPTGYKFRLTGTICTAESYVSNNYLTVYDGANNTDTPLIDGRTSSVSNDVEQLDPVTSTSNTMRVRFYSNFNSGGSFDGGIDLLIELVNANASYDVTVNNTEDHGYISSDKATSKVGEIVTLTASTDDGYFVENISVTDGNSQPVSVEGGKWYNYYTQNKATFVMPNSAATVSSTYTNAKTADDGLHIDLPKNGLINVAIPEGIQSFNVYDNGGASGNYDSNCRSTLVLTAPTGYELQLTGTITTEYNHDYLSVYDGTDEDINNLLLDEVKSTTANNPFDIGTVVSTTGSMRFYFWTNSDNYNSEGLNLRVEIINANIKKNITLDNSDAGGSVVSDKTEAAINEAVALTLTPADATYLPSGLTITSSSPAKLEWIGSFSNNATMTMPFADVTIAPTFTQTWTAAGGLFASIPRNGNESADIPAGVESFKIYDHGGPNGNYDEHIEGQLTLNAPTGYKHQLTGTVTTCRFYDALTVRDNVASTDLIDRIRSTSDGTPLDIGTVTSSGESITLYFESGWGHEYAGLDLTSTLVPIEYSITYTNAVNGSDGVTNTNLTTYTVESAAITLSNPTKDGYTFGGWYDDSGFNTPATTTIAAGSTGNKTFYAKWTENTCVLTEDDGVTKLINDWQGKQVNVSFSRTFTKDVASTVCLPFDFTPTGGTYYVFHSVDKSTSPWTVTMAEADPDNRAQMDANGHLLADTPYLFMPSADGQVDFIGTIANVSATYTAGSETKAATNADGTNDDTHEWQFKGTYVLRTWYDADPGNIYAFSANQITATDGVTTINAGEFFRISGGDKSKLRPFRACMEYVTKTSPARGVSRTSADDEVLPDKMIVRLIGRDNTTTQIGTLDTRTGEVTFDGDAWYSLDGRKLNGKPTKKGMYIQNGRKVVIK